LGFPLNGGSAQMMDALIVGAGPGGCTLAWHLRRCGWRVGLVERRNLPADKLCGEFLSGDGLRCLRDMFLYEALLAAGAQKVEYALLSAGATTWFSPLPRAGLGLSRYVFDMLLADACKDAGVQWIAAQVSGITGDLKRGFALQCRDGMHLEARLVIGAWGRRGGVFPTPAQGNILALKVQAEFEAMPPQVELHAFPGGYAGLCAIEGGRATLGLLTDVETYRRAGQSAEGLAQQNMVQNSYLAERLQQLQPDWKSGQAVAGLDFGTGQAVCRDVLLMGDAAAQISPLCGDGMSIALRSGQLLAPLAAAFLNADIDGEQLKSTWRRRWHSEFGKRLYIGRILQGVILRAEWARVALAAFNVLPMLGRGILRWTRG